MIASYANIWRLEGPSTNFNTGPEISRPSPELQEFHRITSIRSFFGAPGNFALHRGMSIHFLPQVLLSIAVLPSVTTEPVIELVQRSKLKGLNVISQRGGSATLSSYRPAREFLSVRLTHVHYMFYSAHAAIPPLGTFIMKCRVHLKGALRRPTHSTVTKFGQCPTLNPARLML